MLMQAVFFKALKVIMLKELIAGSLRKNKRKNKRKNQLKKSHKDHTTRVLENANLRMVRISGLEIQEEILPKINAGNYVQIKEVVAVLVLMNGNLTNSRNWKILAN